MQAQCTTSHGPGAHGELHLLQTSLTNNGQGQKCDWMINFLAILFSRWKHRRLWLVLWKFTIVIYDRNDSMIYESKIYYCLAIALKSSLIKNNIYYLITKVQYPSTEVIYIMAIVLKSSCIKSKHNRLSYYTCAIPVSKSNISLAQNFKSSLTKSNIVHYLFT